MFNIFKIVASVEIISTTRRMCAPPPKWLKRSRGKSFGFTLAEVLITLGIIGVVAALTIPTLMANNQKQEYVTRLKKAYTNFNQVINQITIDKGSPGDLSGTGIFDTGTDSVTLYDEVVKYFNVIKECRASGDRGCGSNSVSFNYDRPGSFTTTSDFGFSFITSDGMTIQLYNFANVGFPNCSRQCSSDPNNKAAKTCANVTFDINGLKGPNSRGRDIFYFYITNKNGPALVPLGGKDVLETSDYNETHWADDPQNPSFCYSGYKDGQYCAGRVIEEGWQMNY